MASNQTILKEELCISWEYITFENYKNDFKFLDFSNYQTGSVKYSELCSFDENKRMSKKYWSYVNNKNITDKSFSGLGAYNLKANTYSPSFRISCDSLPANIDRVSANCWVYPKSTNQLESIALVISVDYPDGNNIWKGVPLDQQVLNLDSWNNINNYLTLEKSKRGGFLKVYIWNNSDEDIVVDEIGVQMQ